MLTPGQIERFKADGVLILRDFFDREEILRGREEVLAYFGRPDSGDDWQLALGRHSSSQFHFQVPLSPGVHPRLTALYRSLHAGLEWHGEDDLMIRPGERSPYGLGMPAHLDFPVASPLRTLANNVIYYTDVRQGGGEFLYWPGSHRNAWDYFRRNPRDYMARGERSQDQTFALLLRELPSEPTAFLGKAGDLLIWHSLLMHSGSVNSRRETRIATVGRWGMPLDEAATYDFERDMWEHWQFAPRPEAIAKTSRVAHGEMAGEEGPG
ncbi:phytanoyl-CoA dioxygenase family protein [Pseudomonas sp. RIT-PI-AD]|uniref:phytanoyl-CoA dioxygenase family protein n=1 Tax=Pseudomonas sp. RIT-PI-AD TaxID=3035294 RepID=UPI0021D85634|nr:phytanoyl-CoA dioxygenase family protein [Pseudomonas sp. RIT-PI-AD]